MQILYSLSLQERNTKITGRRKKKKKLWAVREYFETRHLCLIPRVKAPGLLAGRVKLVKAAECP